MYQQKILFSDYLNSICGHILTCNARIELLKGYLNPGDKVFVHSCGVDNSHNYYANLHLLDSDNCVVEDKLTFNMKDNNYSAEDNCRFIDEVREVFVIDAQATEIIDEHMAIYQIDKNNLTRAVDVYDNLATFSFISALLCTMIGLVAGMQGDEISSVPLPFMGLMILLLILSFIFMCLKAKKEHSVEALVVYYKLIVATALSNKENNT